MMSEWEEIETITILLEKRGDHDMPRGDVIDPSSFMPTFSRRGMERLRLYLDVSLSDD